MPDKRRFPALPALECYALPLAHIVAETSLLPHPETVRAMAGPAFPTRRARRETPRQSVLEKDGESVAMYDDNATPEWALVWAHGLSGTRPKGWTVAHVWAAADDIGSYTHLANLALVPECFGSLTDKIGPLTHFLRWHAWAVYGWKPADKAAPVEPDGYKQITWRYLERSDDPRGCIRARLARVKNQRAEILRPIMGRLGTF